MELGRREEGGEGGREGLAKKAKQVLIRKVPRSLPGCRELCPEEPLGGAAGPGTGASSQNRRVPTLLRCRLPVRRSGLVPGSAGLRALGLWQSRAARWPWGCPRTALCPSGLVPGAIGAAWVLCWDNPSWAVTMLWRGAGSVRASAPSSAAASPTRGASNPLFSLCPEAFATFPTCLILPEAAAEGTAHGHPPRCPPGARAGAGRRRR